MGQCCYPRKRDPENIENEIFRGCGNNFNAYKVVFKPSQLVLVSFLDEVAVGNDMLIVCEILGKRSPLI